MDAAAGGELPAVFLAVVRAAIDSGVLLVGAAEVDPLDDVVDLAEVPWQVAPGVIAASHQQLGRLTGGSGEQSDLAAHVDRDTAGIDDHTADMAGKCGSQHVVRVQWRAVGGLAAHAGKRIGVGHEVGEQVAGGADRQSGERIDRVAGERGSGGEASVGEYQCPRAPVDDEVDERVGRARCIRSGVEVGVGPAHHVDERVVAALLVGAVEWLAGRIGAVFFPAGGGVLAELVLAESTEDRFEFLVDERIAAAGIEVEFAADGGDVHVAAGDLLVAVAVRTIGVGEHLEALQRDDEVVVAVPLGEFEQHRCEVDETVADPPVAVHPGDGPGLGHPDAPGLERLGQTRQPVDRMGEATFAGHVGVRPVACCPQVALHRPMPIGQVEAPLFDPRQRQRHLRFDPAAQQLQGANPLVEFGLGGVEQFTGDVVDRAVTSPDRVAQLPQIHTNNST